MLAGRSVWKARACIERGPLESFAYDIRNKSTPRFYVTKDDKWGELRQFTPDNANWNEPWGILHESGILEYLVLAPNPDGITVKYSWVSDRFTSSENAMNNYPNAEGVDVLNG